MTKLLRFAGVALLALTIGVFGCDDDADPVAPTVTVTVPTTPPPPPPPLAATMTPDAQTIGVGGIVVFAVSVSGGVAGEAASWTCASSDPSKATVSAIPVGCQATAVAVGGTSITAVVTKGGATTNAGAGFTITEDMVESAFMALASIEDSDDDAEVLSGKVSVTLNVERGDETLMQLSVLVDGVVAAILPFGGISAVAAPQDEPAQQQAVHAFVLAFNSAGYDAVTGEATYMNGERTISAELMVAGKDEPYRSGAHAREFDNDNGYVVTADLGDNSAIGDDGRQWYGGPGNGTIDITALPVSYSGGSVTTVSANFCGKDATDSDGADGYTFEFECEGESKTVAADGLVGDMLTLSSPGEAGVILNDDHPFPAFVDFVGPTNSPIIVANRNGRENGWLNAAVALTGEVDEDEDDDENWLVEGADETGGIGGYNMMLQIGEDLKAALVASPGSSLPDESADKDSYCAVALATDDLGNESELPDAKDTCRAAPVGADALYVGEGDVAMMPGTWGQIDENDMGTEDDSGQTLKFAVDTTDPVVDDIDGDMRYAATEPGEFSFDAFDDEGVASGDNLHSVPLMVRIQKRDASSSECLEIAVEGTVGTAGADDRDCAETTALALGGTVEFDTPTHAYYTLWASARDQAGNRSAEVSHTFVFDNKVATATAPAVPGIIGAGEAIQMATSLNDDLSIRDYYVTTDYVLGQTPIELGVGLPKGVDDFDAASLTHRNHNILVSLPQPYKGLQGSPADADATAIAGVTVAVRDQTQADYGLTGGMQSTFTVEDPDVIADEGFTVTFSAIDAVCLAEGKEDCGKDEKSETTLEVVATAKETGSFNNPFDRVDFWMMDVNGAHWKLPVTASVEAGRTDTRERTWTYSVVVPAAMLRMMTREADFPPTGDSDSHMVRMFAVDDDGIAVTLSKPVTINDRDMAH